MVLMPEQRVQIISEMVDDWIRDFGVTIDATENPMYAEGAAKGLYPFQSWQEGLRQMSDKSGFWKAFENVFPVKKPESATDVKAFIDRLNNELPPNVKVIIVPQDLSEYTIDHRGEKQKVKTLSVGSNAGHFHSAKEQKIKANIGGEKRDVEIVAPVPNSTSLIFISEKVLENPPEAIIAIAHEGGHEEELYVPHDILDSSGTMHHNVRLHTEVLSALGGIRGALHFAKWFGVDLETVDVTAVQVAIFKQVTT